ncbi:MAG: HEPN domain-containing protein [Akkermansiaceae bacterium]
MSESAIAFQQSIKGAEELLKRFDEEKITPSDHNAEVLKRAGYIIAAAAWDTYLKDRMREEISMWLSAMRGSPIANFAFRQLKEDLRRFNSPNSSNAKQLFIKYFDIDITKSWAWDNYDTPQAKRVLDGIISKRGDAAHQANKNHDSKSAPHLVKRDELEKAIRFLKGLVEATDKIPLANNNQQA